MEDFESIVLEIYHKNKNIGFIDEPNYIKKNTYHFWDKW